MKITNNTSRDMSNLTKTLESFVPYTQERLGYDKPFQLFFETDVENSKNIFGKTAYYDPANMNIHVYVDGRHDKDMLRSISHEIVHHHQNCRGDFDGAFEVGEGYAQKSPHLRNMEAEAYLLGNGFLVRDYEDSVKMGDLVLQEWKNKKEILKEMKNKPSVQRLEKHPMAAKFIEIAAKMKIDDPIEMGQLLSSIALSLGLDAKKIPAVLVQFKKDILGDVKAAGADGEAVQQEGEHKKPDFLDLDKDGDTEEPMSKAAKDKELKEGIKDHIKNKNHTLSEQLMKKWFKKGDE
tara:strand:+ start:542 stop:1420 length:879 start_codon:yes stop_codon:yes gene_type:complete